MRSNFLEKSLEHCGRSRCTEERDAECIICTKLRNFLRATAVYCTLFAPKTEREREKKIDGAEIHCDFSALAMRAIVLDRAGACNYVIRSLLGIRDIRYSSAAAFAHR